MTDSPNRIIAIDCDLEERKRFRKGDGILFDNANAGLGYVVYNPAAGRGDAGYLSAACDFRNHIEGNGPFRRMFHGLEDLERAIQRHAEFAFSGYNDHLEVYCVGLNYFDIPASDDEMDADFLEDLHLSETIIKAYLQHRKIRHVKTDFNVEGNPSSHRYLVIPHRDIIKRLPGDSPLEQLRQRFSDTVFPDAPPE